MPRILKSLIQSNFGGDHGNFEAVILEGDRLVHWWHDNTDPALPWERGQVIVPQGVAAAGSIIQSDFRSGDHGNFEVVVPMFADDGTLELWHFWHDNSDVNLPWQRGQRIAANVAGPGVIIQSDFRSGDHGNFEVLAEECTQSVVAYWHPNQDVNLPWMRGNVLLGEPYPTRVTSARKVVQLAGEFDRQGWDGQGTPPFAFNRTESRFGIRGCDLGSSFEHRNRVYFLFGDTWRVNQTPAERDLDSIAFCTDTDPSTGLNLIFNNRPPLLPAPGVSRARGGRR